MDDNGLVPKRDYSKEEKYENEEALMMLQAFAEAAVEMMEDLRQEFVDLGKVCKAIDVDTAMVKAHAAQQEKLRLKALEESQGATSGDGYPTRLNECSECGMMFGHRGICSKSNWNRQH